VRAFIAGRPEFPPREKNDVLRVRQSGDLLTVEKIGGIIAPAARHADDVRMRRGAARPLDQARPHFSARPDHQQFVDPGKRGAVGIRGRGKKRHLEESW
jgi:hypothetical protein